MMGLITLMFWLAIMLLGAGVLHLNKRVCELELRDKNRQARGCDGNWMT